jgi:hypothetical protein
VVNGLRGGEGRIWRLGLPPHHLNPTTSLAPRGGEVVWCDHISTTRQSGARLNRWLISSSAAPWLQSVRHAWGASGDHAAVLLTLIPTDHPFHWPRSWVFSRVYFA